MTSSVDQQMTEIYCLVDEFLKTSPALGHWRRSPHARPQFSDAEVLTVALLQGVFAVTLSKPSSIRPSLSWSLEKTGGGPGDSREIIA